MPWQALNCNIVQPCSEWFSEQWKAMQGLSRDEYFSNASTGREICTPTRPQGFLPSAGLTHRMSTVTGQCKAFARSISGKQGQLRKIYALEILEVKCLPHWDPVAPPGRPVCRHSSARGWSTCWRSWCSGSRCLSCPRRCTVFGQAPHSTWSSSPSLGCRWVGSTSPCPSLSTWTGTGEWPKQNDM